jgi:protein-S-isoprenylcysteine O-methyltransferase Ste14
MANLSAPTDATLVQTSWRLIIHNSSWIAWLCFGLDFVLTAFLAPAGLRDMAYYGPALWLMLAGIAAFFALVIYFQRQINLRLTTAHYGEPQQLVTKGPFSVSRNPIYVAFLIPLASLAYCSPVAAIIAMVVYVIVMNIFVIAGEERELEAKFGDTYRTYKAQTPRWLFGIG